MGVIHTYIRSKNLLPDGGERLVNRRKISVIISQGRTIITTWYEKEATGAENRQETGRVAVAPRNITKFLGTLMKKLI